MISKNKIEAVREYLQDEFDGSEVCDVYYDAGGPERTMLERNFRKFQVIGHPVGYVVKLERIFLDDTQDVKQALTDIELGRVMRFNQGRQVLVTMKGLVVL